MRSEIAGVEGESWFWFWCGEDLCEFCAESFRAEDREAGAGLGLWGGHFVVCVCVSVSRVRE